jgi:hypothetical protein
MDRKRREFIKKTGMAAVGVVAFPALISTMASVSPVSAESEEGGKTGFTFLHFSDGAGGLAGKTIFMNGSGKFGSGAAGGGNYVIFDNTTFAPVDSGSWKAMNFVSFTNVGIVIGGYLGGTLKMHVVLRSSGGNEAKATLTVNCDGGALGSPPSGGGDGSGDVLTLVVSSGVFAGTFGPGATADGLAPFNINVFSVLPG